MNSATAGDPQPAAAFDVVTAVWGAEYVRLMLELCVPNQLSAGNLPALPPGSRYRIFTAAGDVAAFAGSEPLAAVRRVMPVDVVPVDMSHADVLARPGTVANSHKRMIACHRRAAADAAAERRAMIFLSPDLVLAEGTMATLVRLHAGGARAVLCPGLRLARHEFLAACASPGAPAALPPRDLVRLALRHLHPATESLMVDGNTDYRPAVYWPVRSGETLDGIVIRTFTLHPLLVDPVLRQQLPGGPIDSHYVTHCVPDVGQVHVVEDSDELVLFELTPAHRAIGKESGGGSSLLPRLVAATAHWDGHQLANWRRSLRIHAGEVDGRWPRVEADAARLAATIERLRPLAPVVLFGYGMAKAWRRREDAWRTSARKLRRRGAKQARLTLERLRSAAQDGRKALRPRVTTKQIARPVRLWTHRTAKAWKLGVKRMRRQIGERRWT